MTVPVVTITCAGVKLGPELELVSLEVRKELDRIPEARLVLIDGGAGERTFKLSDGAAFEPGTAVVIEIRGEGTPEDVQLFAGLVVRQTVEATSEGSELRVELRDRAIKLTRRRTSMVHRKQTDDSILRAILEAAGIKVGTLDECQPEHDAMVQYNATDWDFMLARADVNGMTVIVDDGEVSVRALAGDATPDARLAHGLDEVLELELELDGGSQWARVEGVAWDPTAQAQSAPAEAAAPPSTAGDLDPAAVADKLGGARLTLVMPGSVAAEELGPWASARLARSRLALIRGRIVVPGRADLRPFTHLALEGVGKRFDGTLLVSGTVQQFDHDGWRTELLIGLSPEWFARTPEIADVPAGGLLPPVTGLQIGTVVDFADDPLGEHRIHVDLPALAQDDRAVWARVARPDAGKDRGFVFWPEVGDEVVVGFLADDPRQAVVLGALHGSVNTPPRPAEGPTEANLQRAIVSKAGTTIAFDDDKKSLTITTVNNNKVVVDDDAGAITLADQHGNTITMNKDGITLKSAKDLKLDAAGEVVIKGQSVDVQ